MEPEVMPAANIVSFDDGNVEYNQRDVSPYATPAITFLIGPNRVKYTVMEGFLSHCKEWMTTPKTVIELPDVDEDIGHTLVHYLYTDKYELLDLDIWNGKLSKYQMSIRSYCVARKYGLDGLANLAQNYTESTKKGKTKGISIFNLLDIAKEVYGKLPDDEDWFPSYLKNEINAAYKDDRGLFTSEAFLKRFGGRKKLDKFLLKCIVEIYTDLLASATSPLEGVVEEQVPSCVEKAPSVEEPLFADGIIRPTEPASIGTPVCAESGCNTDLPSSEYVEATRQADLSPMETVNLPAEDESLRHECPRSATKKKSKKGKKTSSVFDWDDVLPEPEVLWTRPSVLDLDQAIQSVPYVPQECVAMPIDELRAGPTKVDDLVLREEEEPLPLTFESPPSLEDEQFSLKSKKKAKKTKKTLIDTPVEESLPLDDGWDSCGLLTNSKKAKAEKNKRTSPWLETPSAPTDSWGSWGEIKKKDLKKQTKEPPAPEADIPSVPEDDSCWSNFAVPKKNKKRRALPRAPTPPSPLAECEEINDS